MRVRFRSEHAVLVLAVALAGCGGGGHTDPGTTFFVTSQKNPTGDVGGLSGADAQCHELAGAVGLGDKTWRAYLSADADGGRAATNARDRIGEGPWVNAEGVTLAKNLEELHARKGDAAVFLDEHGQRIPGYWPGSPKPAEHDIMTGSLEDGTVYAGRTCRGWTSASTSDHGQVGHTDGLDSDGKPIPPNDSWNSAHPNQDCSDTGPFGGAGRMYCFVAD